MAQSRFYSATAQPTVLTGSITPATTVINVQSVTGFPASVPYILALDYNTPSEEIVLVTAAAGTSLTVTRAYDGTSGTSHNTGAGVRHTWTAMDGNDSRFHEGASQAVHGLVALSSVVGTLDVQTLSNKTLTAPVINNPTFGGTVTLASPVITGTVTGGASYTGITATNPTITGTVAGGASYTAPTITGPTISGNVSGDPTFTAGAAIGSTGQFDVDTSGNLTQAGNINTQGWTTFVPTWSSTGAAPALGNGTLTSKYMRVGRTIHWKGQLAMGTTTTGGTGLWFMSLPVAQSTTGSGNFTELGSCNYIAGGNNYVGLVSVNPTDGDKATFVVKTTFAIESFDNVSGTIPVAVANGNVMLWDVVYEAAS